MKKFFFVVMLMAGAGLSSVSCAQDKEAAPPKAVEETQEVVKAPDVILKTQDGRDQSLLAFIKDKKTILFFWATWCPHCRSQLKEMDASKTGLKAQNIQVVLIDVGEAPQKALKFLADKGYDFDILFDPDSMAAETYGVVGVPTIVLVGKDGNARGVANEFPEDYAKILE
jgi:peroxiredoxin